MKFRSTSQRVAVRWLLCAAVMCLAVLTVSVTAAAQADAESPALAQLIHAERMQLQTHRWWRWRYPYITDEIPAKGACENPLVLRVEREIAALRFNVPAASIRLIRDPTMPNNFEAGLGRCEYRMTVNGTNISGIDDVAFVVAPPSQYPDLIAKIEWSSQ